ncbi:uncharacterized protein [Miscanthus floridulus]|uniref:uncharacterized protein n=1 Tax=Miscanthus floridulus TaxID=154761 RepID=UPI00345A7A17
MDYSRTCYAKDMSLLPQILHQTIDDEFFRKLDSYARCKLPIELKDAIHKLIEKHCLNYGVSVNFNVNSITALSDEMRLIFIKLWKHVYSVSEMSQVLVLEVIMLLSDSVEKDEHFGSPVGGLDASPIISEADLRGSGVNSNGKYDPDLEVLHPSQYKLHQNLNDPSNGNVVDGVSKLKKNCYTDVGPSSPKLMSSSRNPLGDISNSKSLRKGCLKKSVFIGLSNSTDLENKYAPNSISPSPMPGYSIYFS